MTMHNIWGESDCKGNRPRSSIRVWFQRAVTGSGAIYLFKDRPRKKVREFASLQAFGWIPTLIGKSIALPNGTDEGWCNYWSDNKTVEFTNDFTTSCIDMTVEQRMEFMRGAAAETDFAKQTNQPIPSQPALAVGNRGEEMAVGQFDPYAAAAAQNARLGIKESKVNNIKTACSTALSTAVENNKDAAVSAAYLTAGKIANDQVTKLASGHLPMIVRGYAGTPLGKLVTANIAQMLIQHFKPKAATANRLAEAMVTQAYAEVLATAGIEDFVDSLLNDPKIAKAMKTVEQADSTQ